MTGIGANRSVAVTRDEIMQVINAPVTPVMTKDESDDIINWVRSFVGAGAVAAGQAAQIRERERAEIEKSNREHLAEFAKKGALNQPFDPNAGKEARDAYDQQNAIYWAKVERDRVRQEINEGKFNIEAGESISDALTRITMDASANRSQIFRDTFNVAFREQAADLLISAQQKFREETYQSMASVTPGAILSSDEAGFLTEDRFAEILKGAQAQGNAFNKSPGEVIERAIMPAAETLALKGRTESLGVMMETLKRHDPAKAAQLQARAEQVSRQNADARRNAALQLVEEYAVTGPDFSRFKLMTDRRAEAGDFSRHDASRLQNDYLSRLLNHAASNGRYEEARHLVKHLSNTPDAKLFGERSIAAAVDRHRDILTDRLIIDTTGGRRDLNDAAAEPRTRLDAWAKNPDAPEAITLNHYQRAVAAIVARANKVDKAAVTAAWIAQNRGVEQTGVRPPIESIADGLKLRWMEDGIAEFIPLPDGEHIWRGVVNPERAAWDSHEQGGVIADWRKQIVQTLNTEQNDSPAMRVAVRSYAAIYKVNRELANDIRSGFTDAGRLRADAIEEDVGRGLPMGDPGTHTVNPEWIMRLEGVDHPDGVREPGVIDEVLRLKPVNFTAEQKRAVLWGAGVKQEKIEQMVRTDLAAALPEEFEQRNKFWHLRFGEVFGESTHRDVAIGQTAVNAYLRIAEEEVANQLARGNDHGAADAAKKRTVERLLREHPPVLWNRLVSVGGSAPQAFTADMEKELLADINAAMGTDSFPFVDTHRPVYEPSLGGWVLLDTESGLPMTLNGVPFKWLPFPPKSYEERVREIEAARKRRQDLFKVKDFQGPIDYHFGQ